MKSVIFADDCHIAAPLNYNTEIGVLIFLKRITTCLSFLLVYSVLSKKNTINSAQIKQIVIRTFLSRVYGKSLLVIHIFVTVFACVKFSLENTDWMKKNKIAYIPIF
jgi:uncharacterized Tic20 family protein